MVWCDQAVRHAMGVDGAKKFWVLLSSHLHWSKLGVKGLALVEGQALCFLLRTSFLQGVCFGFFFLYYLPHPMSILFIFLLVINFLCLVSCLVLGSPISLLVAAYGFYSLPPGSLRGYGHNVLPAWEFILCHATFKGK